jgi:hypothetical protein
MSARSTRSSTSARVIRGVVAERRRVRRLREFAPFEPLRVWLYHRLPPGLLWHPGEWLLAFMCCFAGITGLVSGVRSDSLSSLLPEGPYKVYSLLLVVGAVALAFGLSSIRWLDYKAYVVTRVPAYRLGLRLLGLNVSLFVAGLWIVLGWAGFFASVIPVAFIGMCILRLIALGGPDDRRK